VTQVERGGSPVNIREYCGDSNSSNIRECVFERQIDRRMPPGEEMADAYMADMLARCEECQGRILVAGRATTWFLRFPPARSRQSNRSEERRVGKECRSPWAP